MFSLPFQIPSASFYLPCSWCRCWEVTFMNCFNRLPCPLTSGWVQPMVNAQETVPLPEVFKEEGGHVYIMQQVTGED